MSVSRFAHQADTKGTLTGTMLYQACNFAPLRVIAEAVGTERLTDWSTGKVKWTDQLVRHGGCLLLEISHARVIVTRPGRNFVTLKIETQDGLTGLGDATLNGRELAVAAYLTEHVIPCLIGRDAHRIEDMWQ